MTLTPPKVNAQPAIHSSKSVASNAGGIMAFERIDVCVRTILAICISGAACDAALVGIIEK